MCRVRSPCRIRVLAAVAFLAVGCGHTIPPPVRFASVNADDHTAKANPANRDPNLEPPFGPFDVQTVFYIDKSNDKDRVDYGMRLDQHCVPTGDDAVFPYWRELEHAPPVRSHELSFLQYQAYGFSEQHTLKKERTGGQYMIRLKQVDRPIVIVTTQVERGYCAATAYTTVLGVKNAQLDHIFVKVAGLMSADWIDVYGLHPKTGAELVERMTP
jgi:Domain of unknown function (DUF4833)